MLTRRFAILCSLALLGGCKHDTGSSTKSFWSSKTNIDAFSSLNPRGGVQQVGRYRFTPGITKVTGFRVDAAGKVTGLYASGEINLSTDQVYPAETFNDGRPPFVVSLRSEKLGEWLKAGSDTVDHFLVDDHSLIYRSSATGAFAIGVKGDVIADLGKNGKIFMLGLMKGVSFNLYQQHRTSTVVPDEPENNYFLQIIIDSDLNKALVQ